MTQSPTNHVTWFQIPADNTQRAWGFYGKVFGWSKDDLYKNKIIAGAINGSIEQRSETLQAPRLVIKVNDIDEMIGRITDGGGEIVVKRTDIPEVNMVFAIFKDTEGNLINIVADL